MSLKSRVTSGVKWIGISQVGRQGLQWITTIILARLLLPSDYGLMGMALIFVNFVQLFRGLGTSSAIIQRKNISEDLLSSIFWLNLAFSFLVTIIIFALSPMIAYFFNESRLTNILRFISLNFIISGFSIVQQALLERDFGFSKITKIELIAVLLSSIVGIVAALLGSGVWSLVYKLIVEITVSTLLLWFYAGWKPKMVFHLAEIKSVTRYSLNLTAYNIWNYFSRNIDRILIGRFLGSVELGYYILAYRVMFFPLLNITNAIARLTLPTLSRLQDDLKKFRKVYLDVIGFIALLTFPMMLGLMAVSNYFVLTLFGAKWESVSLLLVILAPVGLIQSIGMTSGGIYQATGRTDWMLRWGIVSGLITVISFVVGLQWGIYGVATAYAIAVVLLAYPNFAIPFKLINLRVSDLLSNLLKPFLCSSLMVGVIIISKMIVPAGLQNSTYFAVFVTVGLVTYIVASWFINGDMTRKILEIAGIRIGSPSS